jgi:two-component sensor histidine kinase
MGTHILETLKTIEARDLKKVQTGVIGIDDVYHREITRELLIVKDHQAIVLESMTDGFLELTPDMTIVYANPAATRHLGVSESEIISKQFSEVVPDTDIRQSAKKCIYLNGRHLTLTVTQSEESDYLSYLVIMRDDTEKKKVELALKEKELLLHELHHRVKNNLTMLTSLINLQKDYVENNQELHHLERLHHRIHSVSLVYHTLMTRDTIVVIDFKEYARQLVDDILSTMLLPKNQIVTTIEADTITFEIETMIPLGLIVTELFTNAIQHGYPLEAQLGKPVVGNIAICLRKDLDTYTLSVTNDGAPFPADIDIRNAKSLGLRLICVLTEQLEGTIELDRTHATSFAISFPVPQ